MKTTCKSIVRAVSFNAVPAKAPASNSASLFLGSKALSELRILMRLAATPSPRAAIR